MHGPEAITDGCAEEVKAAHLPDRRLTVLVNDNAEGPLKVAVVVPMKRAPKVMFVVDKLVAIGASLVLIVAWSPALGDLDHRTRRMTSVRHISTDSETNSLLGFGFEADFGAVRHIKDHAVAFHELGNVGHIVLELLRGESHV